VARGLLTVTTINRSGVNVAGVAGTSEGSSFANNGNVFIEVNNVHATLARVITVVTPSTVLGLAIADLTVSIPALSTRKIGPFPPAEFNQVGDNSGLVFIEFPAGTESDLHVAAYRF
jgi:hypothetical protein